MRQILVSGGSGFVGRYLIRRLFKEYEDVKIKTISRSENNIHKMLVENPNCDLTPIIGDVRDIDTVKHALRDVDAVIHLSAMKHIGFCEQYPAEAIAINVDGTRNLLESFQGTTFIGMSTDKAVEARNCYGATKLLMEKLILDRAKTNDGKRFIVIRSGNLFGSTGSVIDAWKQQLKQNGEITVTNLEMTRFFINVETMVGFITRIMDEGENGKIYIPYQKAIKLADLAEVVIELYGDEETKIKTISPRAGERTHEILFAEGEEVVCSQENRHSEYSPMLSKREIQDWLNQLEKGANDKSPFIPLLLKVPRRG
jgi:UDP-N-acetylglucosamine 4,6-dehydratase